MEPLPTGPQTEIQQASRPRDGIAGRYSRTRNSAASREAQARGGRSEEVQAERHNEARSHGKNEAREPHRGGRKGARGERGGSRRSGEARPSAERTRPDGTRTASGDGEFAAQLQSKTRQPSKPAGLPEQAKLAGQASEQEPLGLNTAVALTKSPEPSPLKSMGGATHIAKASGASSRGSEIAVNTGATARAKGAGKTANTAKPNDAAPILEREQASEVLRQVRLQLFPENRAATVHLNPAELGRVSIRVVVEGDQVQAVVRAETPEALAALEQHMPELQASLGDRGFQDAQLDLALGFEGEDNDSTQGSRSEEPTPTQVHRLFANAEGVDYYA